MATPEAAERRSRRSVFFLKDGSREIAEHISKNCTKLLGSEAYVDHQGRIFYRKWPRLPRKGLLPPAYVRISKVHPRADIYAPYTRYTNWHELIPHQVKKDGGSVEAAIRNMDHILEGTRGKETRRVTTVSARASKLFDLFSKSFSEITPEQFARTQAKTREMLAKAYLNPDDIIDEEIARMSEYLDKGSSGHASDGYENMIVSLGALMAAYRRAVERRLGLSEAVSKFVQMREALIITRQFDRSMFEEVADRFAPTYFPALAMFKHPQKYAYDRMSVVGALGTAKFQLEQTHVLPYRGVALELLPKIDDLQKLLRKDKREDIIEQGLLSAIHQPLVKTLEDHRDIYPNIA